MGREKHADEILRRHISRRGELLKRPVTIITNDAINLGMNDPSTLVLVQR
jgi:hypothetical protein